MCLPIIVPVLCDISNPRQCLVSTLLHDFEVSHLNSRYSEIWDLEFDSDRCAFF